MAALFSWQPRQVQEIIRKQAYNYPTDVWSSLGWVGVTAGTIKKFQFQKVSKGTTNSLKYPISLLLPQVSRDLLEIIPKKRQLVSFQTFSLALNLWTPKPCGFTWTILPKSLPPNQGHQRRPLIRPLVVKDRGPFVFFFYWFQAFDAQNNLNKINRFHPFSIKAKHPNLGNQRSPIPSNSPRKHRIFSICFHKCRIFSRIFPCQNRHGNLSALQSLRFGRVALRDGRPTAALPGNAGALGECHGHLVSGL